jgi:hypothetical protein
MEDLQKQIDTGKIAKEKIEEEKSRVIQDMSEDFDRNLASDAFNVDNELRKRLDPKTIAHIPRVPAFIDADGNRLTFAQIVRGTGADAFFIRGLANEIEQMSKLLPPDSAKTW